MTELILDSRVINLNSKDSVKLNSQKNSNVYFKFKNILKEDDDVYYITCGLLSAQIPVSFYNVNVNNQYLSYSVNGTAYSLTIPEGNYNAYGFISSFQTQFSNGAHGKALTVTLDKLTGRFTFTLTTSYTLVLNSATSTIFKVLGFDISTDYTITSSQLAPYPANFLGVKKIKVLSSALANFSYDSNTLGNTNLIQTITVNDSAFGMVTYQNQIENYGRLKTKRIDEIDIQLRDEDDALIDLNGIDWGLTFHLNLYRRIPTSDTKLDLKPLEILINHLDDNSQDIEKKDKNEGGKEEDPKTISPTMENEENPTLGQNVENYNHGDSDLDVLLYNHIL